MNSEWQVFRLGEVTSCSSGSTPSKLNPKFWGGDVPWVSAKDMKAFYLYGSEDGITEEALSEGAKIAPKGAVLVLTRGMTLLNDVPICLLKSDSSFNQDVKAFRSCDPVLVAEYLPYLLLGHKSQLQSLVDLAGHGTGRLATDLLLALEISLPSPREQKAIAHLLGTLDDKIELNRKTNETLEAMAKALFQAWYVDFDPVRAKADGRPTGLPDAISDLFPDSFEESELGEIPRGWEFALLGDISEWRSGSTPSKANPEYWGGTIPWISASSMKDTFAISSDLSLTEAGVSNGGRLAPEGAILLLVRGSGLHSRISCCLASAEMAFNQDVKAISAKTESILSTSHIFAYLQARASELLEMVEFTGIGAGKLDTDRLEGLPIAVPSRQLVKISEEFLDASYERIKNNLTSSIRLGAIREALLPKLISGELRIPEAEQLLEEAGV